MSFSGIRRFSKGPHRSLLIACQFLATACVAQELPAQQFGVNIHSGQKSDVVERQLGSGSLSVRTDFHWAALESQKGTFAFPDYYKDLDDVVTYVSQHGGSPLIVLDYGNRLYTGSDGEEPSTPAEIAAFSNYVKFVVGHFKGRVKLFEVWNEWNYNGHSVRKPHVFGEPGAYVNLLRKASEAIKSVDQDAIVIGATPGGLDSNWINKFIGAGGLSYLDAFAVHPYVLHRIGGTKQPSEPAAVAKNVGPPPVLGTPEDSMAWIDSIHDHIAAAGGHRSIPIYVTENGWPTNTGELGVRENVEAAYLQRFLLLSKTRPWIAGVWWYELIDGGVDPSNSEQRFGILNHDGTPKPAYNALMQIKDVLRSPSKFTESMSPSGEITVAGPYANNRNFSASWMSTDDFTARARSQALEALLGGGYRALTSKETPGSTVGAVPVLVEK